MTASFQPDSSGFRAMAVGAEVRAAVDAETRRAEGIARGFALDFEDTGAYLDAFEIASTTIELKTSFGSHPVAAGVLSNSVVDEKGHGYAAAVEWGNKDDHRAHHVFGRTLGALE